MAQTTLSTTDIYGLGTTHTNGLWARVLAYAHGYSQGLGHALTKELWAKLQTDVHPSEQDAFSQVKAIIDAWSWA
jgi:hypothetical protein